MTFSSDPRPGFETARAIVRSLASASSTEDIVLSNAIGRVIARPVYAKSDHPRFDCSAMDGFAVAVRSFEATSVPVDIPIGSEIRAGAALAGASCGLAIPISTGAFIPREYDAVLTREKTTIIETPEGRYLRLIEHPTLWANIRRRAEDGRIHDQLVWPGDVVSAEAVGALAAFGTTHITVFKRPRLAMLRTGDEVSPTGELPGSGQIFDVNGPMIAAMAKRAGLLMDLPHSVHDDDSAIAAGFSALD